MQSYLQYRRLGAELKGLQQQDETRFHRKYSQAHHDRSSLHETLTSGSFRHAACGDLSYLKALLSIRQQEQEQGEDSQGSLSEINDSGSRSNTNRVVNAELTEAKEQPHITEESSNGSRVFVVEFSADDTDDPHNWSMRYRLFCVLQVAMVGFLTLVSSSIDSAIAPQAATAFHVSAVTESIATGRRRVIYLQISKLTYLGIWLIGSEFGSLVVGPFSETFGRNRYTWLAFQSS